MFNDDNSIQYKDSPVMYLMYYMNGRLITTEIHATYATWQYRNDDGTETHIISENLSHPLEINISSKCNMATGDCLLRILYKQKS